MAQRLKRAVGVGLGAASLLSAFAARGDPIDWTCQSDADHFSAYGSAARGGAYAIEGQTFLQAPKPGGRYLPTATIRIESPDGLQSSALHIAARIGRRFPILTVFIITKKGGQSHYTFTKDVNLRDGVEFHFSLTADGKIALVWNEKTYLADFVPLPVARLHVSCSSGDFNFKNLKVSPEDGTPFVLRATNRPLKE